MEKVADWIESGKTRANYAQVDRLSHPDAQQALRFWQERPVDGILMGRDIPSRSIARLLSRIVIYEPVDGGADFKVHLAGASIRHRFGRDISGESIALLFTAGDLPLRRDALNGVLMLNEPRMACIVHSVGKVEILKIELLQVPVTAPNGRDRWVLTFVFYF